tara:strand:- start:797 stop:964 length:168 start_codon:yes stop_codon:yes gene_type:complete
MNLLLYSYCKIFQISPHNARDTPLDLMLDMLTIHGEAEKLKTDEIEKMSRKVKNG